MIDFYLISGTIIIIIFMSVGLLKSTPDKIDKTRDDLDKNQKEKLKRVAKISAIIGFIMATLMLILLVIGFLLPSSK